MLLTLRPYQEEALQAIDRHHLHATKRQLVVLPTGVGKTVIFASLIGNRSGRALVLAHRQELLHQASEKLRWFNPDRSVGLIQAEHDDTEAEIVVASVPTLTAQEGRRLLELPTTAFDTLVIDEAHHAVAPSYRTILDHFSEAAPLVVGFTATTARSDEQALGSIFEALVYERDLVWAIEEGYLVDIRGERVMLDANLAAVRTHGADLDSTELEALLQASGAPDAVAEAYVRFARDRTGIVFCASVQLSEETARALCRRGIVAEHLDGTLPGVQRQALLGRLHDGQTQVVCNYGVLTEGFDEPRVDCIVIARPTLSLVLYTQMVGRGLRPYFNKHDCLVIDTVGTSERAELITLASLTGRESSGSSLREERQRELTRLLNWDGHTPLTAWEIDLLDGHWRRQTRPPRLHWEHRTLRWMVGGAEQWRPGMRDLGSKDRTAWQAEVPTGTLAVVRNQAKELPFDRWLVMFQPKVAGLSEHVTAGMQPGLPLDLAFGVANDWLHNYWIALTMRNDAVWRQLPPTTAQRRATRGQARTRGEAELLKERMLRTGKPAGMPVKRRKKR